MDDYIKRDDAIRELNAEGYTKNMRIHKRILDIPAANVRENMRGEWVGEADGYADGSLVYDMWYCSHCGYRCEDDEPPKWNYCPICGADMRGEKNGTQT